jgi:hypothetical protein
MAQLAECAGGRIMRQMGRVGDNNDAKKTGNREGRLAAALRENLRRRKAQERGRSAPPATGKPEQAGLGSPRGPNSLKK